MSWVGYLVILCVLVAGCVAAELLARAWMVRAARYFVWTPYYRREIRLDASVHPQLEPHIVFEVNSDGERGAEHPGEVDGLYRILVAGGSAVECALNDQSSAWPARLAVALSLPDRLRVLGASSVHVGNIGRSGVDARALDLIFRRVLPRYPRLDLVLIMLGPGDLVRWTESGAPGVVAVDALAPSACFEEHPEELGSWRLRQLALVRYAAHVRRRLLRPVDRRVDAGRWYGRARAMRQRAREVRTSAPDATHMIAVFEAHLRSLVDRARRAAPRVMLIRQPSFRKEEYSAAEEALFWHGGIGNAYRGDDVTVFFSTRVIFDIFDDVNARIQSIAKELGIEYVDATPALEMSASTFYDHFHLTAAGSAAFADAVARAVVEGQRDGGANRSQHHQEEGVQR